MGGGRVNSGSNAHQHACEHTDPVDGCGCESCRCHRRKELRHLRSILSACQQMHAPDYLRTRIVIEVRKMCLTIEVHDSDHGADQAGN